MYAVEVAVSAASSKVLKGPTRCGVPVGNDSDERRFRWPCTGMDMHGLANRVCASQHLYVKNV